MKIKNIHILLLINAIYMIPATYLFLQRSNMEFLGYLGIILILGAIVVPFQKKLNLENGDLWALSFFGFAHMMGGLILFSNGTNLYQQILIDIVDNGGGYVILKMDQVIHCLGYGTLGFILFGVFNRKLQTNKNMILFLAILVSVGFGALNEVIEFIVVLLTEFNGVGDLHNMGFDLIFNLTGAIVGSSIQYFRLK